MTKEKFVKRMSLIQNFRSQQETLTALINKLTDGRCIIEIGDYLVEVIIDMINDSLKIEDRRSNRDEGLLDWWLCPSNKNKKVIYLENSDSDEKVERSVVTLEDLYDYIIEYYNKIDENKLLDKLKEYESIGTIEEFAKLKMEYEQDKDLKEWFESCKRK